MTEASRKHLKFILNCLEYLLILAVFFECNSVYLWKAPIHSYTDMYSFYYRFVMVDLLLILGFNVALYPRVLDRIEKYFIVIFPYLAVAIGFFFANVNQQVERSQQEYIRNFLILLPLFIILFRMKVDQGQSFDLLYKHSNIVCGFAAFNQVVYFTTVLNLSSISSNNMYTTWPGYIDTRRDFINVTEIFNGVAWQLFDIPLLRNYGVFTEPLMYVVPLITALSTELFLRPSGKRVYRWILLSVTIITVQSTLGLMMLALIWGVKLVEMCIRKKKIVVVFPIILASVGMGVLLFVEKNAVTYAKYTNSTLIHVRQVLDGFRLFRENLLFGIGYQNMIAGYSNSGPVILGEGGIVLGTMCMLPFFVCFVQIFFKGKRRLAEWAIGPFLCYMFIIWHYHIFMIFLLAFGYSLIGRKITEEEWTEADSNAQWLIPKWSIGLAAALIGVLLIAFGKPVWSGVDRLLYENQWSVTLSAIKAFYFNAAIALNIVLITAVLKKEEDIKMLMALAGADVVYLFIYKAWYSFVNTLSTVRKVWNEADETATLFVVWVLLLLCIRVILWFVTTKHGVTDFVTAAACIAIAAFMTFIYPKSAIGGLAYVFQEDQDVLMPVLENAIGKVYCNEYPAAYAIGYEGISFSGTKDFGFCKSENVTLICRKCAKYRELFDAGFEMAQLSDKYIVYSNDVGVIDGLTLYGYDWYRYFPCSENLNLSNIASANGLSVTESGGILVEGSERSIEHTYHVDLTPGRYNAYYNVHIDKNVINSSGELDLGVINITADYSERTLAMKAVKYSSFDENGDAVIEVIFGANTSPYTVGVEFTLQAFEDYQIEVRSIYYEESPESITVYKRDGYGNPIREEYYNVDGSPYTVSGGYEQMERVYDLRGRVHLVRYYDGYGDRKLVNAGYSAIEYEYNRQGSIVSEKYYDEIDNPTMINAGYAEIRYEYDENRNRTSFAYYDLDGEAVATSNGYENIKRQFDEIGNIIREEYCNDDGQITALESGVAAVEYDYDENRNRVAVRYYDTDNEPILFNNAYWQVKYKYNEKKQNIHEEYYGIDGNHIQLKDGSYGYDREYDAVGNVVRMTYLGADMLPTINAYGYATLQRTYDENKYITTEQYYDVNGNQIALADGQAAVEYEYDENGNRCLYRYYDADNNPVLFRGAYWYNTINYNDKKQNVLERFYGIDGNPILLSDGAAGYEREYDEAGNVIKLTYLGLDGNPTLNVSNYSSWKRQFNELKQIVREEYYGTNDEIIALAGGQHAVEYSYDEAGNRIMDKYYDVNNAPVLYYGSFCCVKRTYNDKKQNIREEYFDTQDAPMINGSGYASVNYEYNDEGKVVKKLFYDLSGALIKEEVVE